MLGLLALANLAAATQGANFNISTAFAVQNGCEKKCQSILEHANRYDHKLLGEDFDFPFYKAPANFSSSQPGDLLKLEAQDPVPLDIRSGTSVYKFMYTSIDIDNKTLVPVTGFIAFPYAPPKEQGCLKCRSDCGRYRAVAFAHGTSGVYEGCAPSNGPSLFDYDSWKILLDRGYAVIATDFAGLGNGAIKHKYCTFPAQANDIYYSMIAARKAFGKHLTREWMSVGHSEGGGAVWKMAEGEYIGKDKNYIGTVALAPATRLIDMAVSGLLGSSDDSNDQGDTAGSGFGSYAPALALGFQRFNSANNMTFLADKMQQRMAISEKGQLCATAMAGLTLDLKLEEIVDLERALVALPALQAWQNATAPSSARTHAPILVVQGLNDTTILPDTTVEAFKRSCDLGSTIMLEKYPGAEHSPLIAIAAPQWLSWMDDRFERKNITQNCSDGVIKPFGALSNIKLPPEDDMEDMYGLSN